MIFNQNLPYSNSKNITAVYTLYIEPFLENDLRWFNEDCFLMSWALSFGYAKKWFKDVVIYCYSDKSEEFIRKCNFDVKVIREHANYPSRLWCLYKVHTYSKQNSPFVHLDNDLFLHHPIPDVATLSPVYCQLMEYVTGNEEWYPLDEVEQRCGGAPLSWLKKRVRLNYNEFLKAPNVGILGFNDMSVNEAYCKEVLEFVNRPGVIEALTNTDNDPMKYQVCLEQFTLGAVAEGLGKSIYPIFPDIRSFRCWNHREISHLFGIIKKNKDFSLKMIRCLENEGFKYEPELYRQVWKELTNGVCFKGW